MKTRLLLTALLSSIFYLLSSQVPQGFTYQAIARGSDGKEIVNTQLQVKISILSDTTGFYAGGSGTYIWEEQQTVETNSLGLFTLIIGNTLASKIQGSAETFSAINWKQQPLYIGTKLNRNGWKNLGTSRLWTVPYAMVAGDLKNNSRVQVAGDANSSDSILFEVKNRIGQTIFAVYEEGVRIYVDDGIYKGKGKGGFAIGGFGTAKAPGQEYFRVTRDSSFINVSRQAKAGKGGFAIGSFDPAKGEPSLIFNLTPENYFIGEGSGSKNKLGLYNSFIGYYSGSENTNGMSNNFLGYKAGTLNTTGGYNTFIGDNSGSKNINGNQNIFIGSYAGTSNTGGQYGWMGSANIFIGSNSGYSNTEGAANIFIGTNAGFKNDVGNLNIYIGDRSGTMSTGMRNTFLGTLTGESNTTGEDNIFIGTQSGQGSSTGKGNTFIGNIAGWKNGTGNDNIYMGLYAGNNNEGGNNNVLVGNYAGAALLSGDRNTFVGFSTGGGTNSSGNVFIGSNAGNNETGSNRLYIANTSADSDNALIYGEFDNSVIKLNGTVNINDVLKLKPRTSPPSPASEGDIYYNSDTHKLYVYDGNTWQACW